MPELDAERRSKMVMEWQKAHPEQKKRTAAKYRKTAKYRNTTKVYFKKYRQTPKGKYLMYKGSAVKRGIVFDISFDYFCSFWKKSCHYCNYDIYTIGLDRVNNELGYSIGNVVPCCTRCNRAKDIMSAKEYIDMCRRVVEKHS